MLGQSGEWVRDTRVSVSISVSPGTGMSILKIITRLIVCVICIAIKTLIKNENC